MILTLDYSTRFVITGQDLVVFNPFQGSGQSKVRALKSIHWTPLLQPIQFTLQVSEHTRMNTFFLIYQVRRENKMHRSQWMAKLLCYNNSITYCTIYINISTMSAVSLNGMFRKPFQYSILQETHFEGVVRCHYVKVQCVNKVMTHFKFICLQNIHSTTIR